MSKPPEFFDVDAEQSLLGAVLLAGRQALEAEPVRLIGSADFWDARHRDIWSAIRKVAKAGLEPDPVTVASELGKAGHRDVMQDYLTTLVNGCPSAIRVSSYAFIVADKSRRRRVIRKVTDLVRDLDSDDPLGTILGPALDDLRAIETAAVGKLQWKLRTLVDAYAPRPPVTHLVGDMFALPSLSIVYGAPDTLKSLLLLDLALTVASGLPWLEPLPGDEQVQAFRTVPVPTLWVDFDNGQTRSDCRVEALARSRDLQPNACPFTYTSMGDPWLDGSDVLSIEGLIQLVRGLNAGLVCIDNLCTVSGDADENSREIAHVMSNFRRLAEDTGASVVLVHHQRKSTGWDRRAGESLRGHSSIEAALDFALLVSRTEGKKDVVTVTSTKSRDMSIRPFGALFTYKHKPGTKELETARFFGQVVEDDDTRAEQAILETVESEQGILKGALTEAVRELEPGVGINRIRGAIDRLVRQGQLEMTLGARNAQHYSLPS